MLALAVTRAAVQIKKRKTSHLRPRELRQSSPRRPLHCGDLRVREEARQYVAISCARWAPYKDIAPDPLRPRQDFRPGEALLRRRDFETDGGSRRTGFGAAAAVA